LIIFLKECKIPPFGFLEKKSLGSKTTVKFFKSLLVLWLGIVCATASGYAKDESTVDHYAPSYSKTPGEQPLKGPFSRIIESPFRLIKWPIDKALVFTEEHRLDRKTKWIYEQILDRGVRPRIDSLDFSGLPSYGADFDLLKMAGKKESYPDLITKGWINHGPTSYFQVGSELGAARIADTGFHTSGLVRYENRRNETFYGIGPHSSRGDSTSYIQETTSVGAKTGYEFSPVMDLSAQLLYDHVNIKNRAHDGKGDITQIFAGQNIPGLYGDSLLKLLLGLTRDTRDSKEDATKGSYQRLSFGFTEGVRSSPARYLTYQLDAAKYFRLASPRRILVTRLFGEFNQPVNGGEVPFYAMAKLGGSGMFPRQGQTARGFVYNRFSGESAMLLNLEYRYTVWQRKEFKMSTYFFLDEGQVSKDFGTFQFNEFRESYGIGAFLSYSQFILLNFSVAHGDEGTQFYIENKLPF